MFRQRIVRLVTVAITAWIAPTAGPAGVAHAEEPVDGPHPTGQIALFEGALIDLAQGWGDARACAIWNDRNIAECFRTEAELEARLAALGNPAQRVVDGLTTTTGSACTSPTRLYDGAGYGGRVLYLWDRHTWIDLRDLGFANRASSYEIGACSAYFADYPGGGGDWYPTSLTSAYRRSSSMRSGWNNRVSSVYLR